MQNKGELVSPLILKDQGHSDTQVRKSSLWSKRR